MLLVARKLIQKSELIEVFKNKTHGVIFYISYCCRDDSGKGEGVGVRGEPAAADREGPEQTEHQQLLLPEINESYHTQGQLEICEPTLLMHVYPQR
jgi:hypothetical protein